MPEVETTQWNAKKILTRLTDTEQRGRIVAAFWKEGDAHARALAVAHMAKTMRFRDETIRKATAAKKAEWLLSRLGTPELNDCFEMALMIHHTNEKKKLMSDFLDSWNIPNVDGTIEVDDYKAPTREQVEASVSALKATYSRDEIALYLATAGLLMGAGEHEWREAMWPVVDQLTEAS